MTEYKYSLSEIDRMRAAIRGNPKLMPFTGFSEQSATAARGRVEDMLRTYMMNGTTPEELESAKATFWQEQGFRKAERERAREEALKQPPEEQPDSPYYVAEKLTCGLPLDARTRLTLRMRIEEALAAIVKVVS